MTDRRLTPANRRVAHQDMPNPPEGVRLVRDDPVQVTAPLVDLCAAPGGARDKQMMLGQGFSLLERRDGWIFGFDPVDGYVGYLPEAAVGPVSTPTHRLIARQSHLYPGPDFKLGEQAALPFFSALEVVGQEGRFLRLAGGGFVPAQHVAPLSWHAQDPVSVAEMFLGTPYLWGGNSGAGIDCSGLVQLAFWATGLPCPRDADMQESLGRDATGAPRRGDLLFWKGHVALVADPGRILHANAHHMAVAYEEMDAAIARIEAQGDGPVTAHRRP